MGTNVTDEAVPDRPATVRARGAWHRLGRRTAGLLVGALAAGVLVAGIGVVTPSVAPAPSAAAVALGQDRTGLDWRPGRGDECRGAAGRFDAATRRDRAFNETFRHGFAQVDDVEMHYVIGGDGDQAMVLLPGWPQSWYEYYEVMFDLAEDYTVIAVDLPGLGDSRGAPPSYDKATLARYVQGLVSEELGFQDIALVGHDLGAAVAFQYAVQYEDEVDGLVVMDYVISGPTLPVSVLRSQIWWFAFHNVPALPEQLISGKQRTYQTWFYDNLGAEPGRIERGAIKEYVRTACDPAKLSGGLELYRTIDEDEVANAAIVEPLDIPVRTFSASAGLTAVPGGVAPYVQPYVSTPVENVAIPDSGHWLAEENPDAVVAELRRFFDAG